MKSHLINLVLKQNDSLHLLCKLYLFYNPSATFGYNRGVKFSMIALHTHSHTNTDVSTAFCLLSGAFLCPKAVALPVSISIAGDTIVLINTYGKIREIFQVSQFFLISF
jgi:hypothetical protein